MFWSAYSSVGWLFVVSSDGGAVFEGASLPSCSPSTADNSVSVIYKKAVFVVKEKFSELLLSFPALLVSSEYLAESSS